MTDAKARPGPWTPDENAALVGLYFHMLDSAHSGRPYNKAAMIRYQQDTSRLNPPLAARSKQSIEFKLMNATAAHGDLIGSGSEPLAGTMHGHGYRAMPNYQAALKTAMREELDNREARYEDAEVMRNEQRAGA